MAALGSAFPACPGSYTAPVESVAQQPVPPPDPSANWLRMLATIDKLKAALAEMGRAATEAEEAMKHASQWIEDE